MEQCPGNSTEVEDCLSAECPGELLHLIFFSSIHFDLYSTTYMLIPGFAGEWHEWSAWSHCDPSCSCARKFRSRECNDPLLGGEDCVGNRTETAPCSEAPYQPSCESNASPGQFGLLIAFHDKPQETQTQVQSTSSTTSSPSSTSP